MNLHKIVNLGKTSVFTLSGGRYLRDVFCEVTIQDGVLSIHGVVGPCKGGRCWGSAGQIQDDIEGLIPDNGWNQEMVEEFLDIWREWHLNDMQAGSARQQAFLNGFRKENGWKGYEEECKALAEAGLLEDEECMVEGKPYRYGSSWLRKELPAEVVAFLRAIPVSLKEPAWV